MQHFSVNSANEFLVSITVITCNVHFTMITYFTLAHQQVKVLTEIL